MQPPVRRVTETLLSGNGSEVEHRGRAALPLRYREDRRSLGFLFLLIGLFAVQWTGMARHLSLIPVTCVFAFVACVIKHNHIHCPTFTSRRWNRAFDYLLSLCTGQSTAAIVPVHNDRHHAHSQTEHDFVRSSLVNFRQNWLNLLLFPFAVVRLVHRNKAADIACWRHEKPGLYHHVQRERAAVLVLVAALSAANWRATMIYLGIPWLFAHWAIVTINLVQHQHCDHTSPYDHSRNVTGRLINWVFLNNGFHTAHHLQPALHWSRLPEFHRLHVEPKIRPELNYRSLLVCLWRQFFHAKARKMS